MGKIRRVLQIELAVVAIHQHTQVYPDGFARHTSPLPRWDLPAARHRQSCNRNRTAGCLWPAIAKPLGHTEPLPHGSRSDMQPRAKSAPGCPFRMLAKRARILQRLAVEIAQLGINRSQCCNSMSFAQREKCLAPRARRILNVQVNETTIKQRDQRNDGRESPGPAWRPLSTASRALLQGEQTNVGVLDGQQLQNSLAHRENLHCGRIHGSIAHAELWCRWDCSSFLLAGYLPTQPPSTYKRLGR